MSLSKSGAYCGGFQPVTRGCDNKILVGPWDATKADLSWADSELRQWWTLENNPHSLPTPFVVIKGR
jgi:hypothetical protein